MLAVVSSASDFASVDTYTAFCRSVGRQPARAPRQRPPAVNWPVELFHLLVDGTDLLFHQLLGTGLAVG